MAALERGTGKRVYTILQLRHHVQTGGIQREFGELIQASKRRMFVLTYVTGRGNWYKSSWKGDVARSGGISTNIGIHLFDLPPLVFWKYTKKVKSI